VDGMRSVGILLDWGKMLHELDRAALGAAASEGCGGHGGVDTTADIFWGCVVRGDRIMVLLRGLVWTWMDRRKGVSILHFWRRRHLL
jgi:hypothetical protein